MTLRFLALTIVPFLALGCGGKMDPVGSLPPSPCDRGATGCDAGTPVADAAPSPDPGSCTTNADCTDLQPNSLPPVCAFPIDGGCSAQGQCIIPAARGCPDVLPVDCACDGTNVPTSWCTGYPDGYDAKPIAYRGACQ
jgi:hypothetical protein